MKVFLFIYITVSGHGNQYHSHEMPDMQTCLTSINKMKINVSQGNENEQSVVAVCAGQKQ